MGGTQGEPAASPVSMIPVVSRRTRKKCTCLLSMGGLARQQEATQDLFTVSRVGATRETAEVAAEVAEEALGQVGSAQAVVPEAGQRR